MGLCIQEQSMLETPQAGCLNTLRPRQHSRHFPHDIFRCIFFNENIWIAINTSLSFVPESWIDNIPPLVQIMAWRRSGDKPLSEPMVVSLLTHICVTRPQWDNSFLPGQNGRNFADNIFRCIFVNEKFGILIKIALKFVPKDTIDNKPALVLLTAWRRIGDKPYMRHQGEMS